MDKFNKRVTTKSLRKILGVQIGTTLIFLAVCLLIGKAVAEISPEFEVLIFVISCLVGVQLPWTAFILLMLPVLSKDPEKRRVLVTWFKIWVLLVVLIIAVVTSLAKVGPLNETMRQFLDIHVGPK